MGVMVENLHEGMTVKNYKELCKLLGEKIKSGNGKVKQLERWKFYFEFERNGKSYVVTKIYDDDYSKNKLAQYKLDKHFQNKSKKEQFNVPPKYCFRAGICKIELDNRIYIGSTRCFSKRFKGHCSKSNPLPTFKMLENGAIFSMVWKAPIKIKEEDLKLRLIEKEKEFIHKYEQDKNYILENTKLKTYEDLELLELTEKCINEFINNKSIKYKEIKINENDYEKAIEILKLNNIIIKEN
jgi:predicted GIY-YIG superfamily endonuclease